MASAQSVSHHWEVVGKNKKTKGGSQGSQKTKKQQFLDNAPRIEHLDPVKEDKTIYSAFLTKEQPVDRGNAASARSDSSNHSSSKKPQTKKKNKTDHDGKKTEKGVSLDEALSKLDVNDLESIISQSQLRFPNHQDVWLKDLASFLNMKLEDVTETDPVFKGKPKDYPLQAVPSPYYKVLNSFIKKFSSQTLDQIFFYGVQTMLTESAKGNAVYGYKLFLQLISFHKNDIAMNKIHQYLELLKTHQNNPLRCISILWVLGQCGVKNLKCGLTIWLDLMLPALEVRQVAYYPVTYLEHLLSWHKSLSNGYGVVTLREYFQVLDVVFSPKFNLSNDLKKRLATLYPRIKDLAYGDMPSHNLRTFFPSYLARFTSATSQAVKTELLDCMTTCLITDKQSFSAWCQLYTKHLPASGHLLEHIANEWPEKSSKFDRQLLKETLRSFSVTNEEIETRSKGQREGLDLCQAAVKELMMKLAGRRFPWSLLIFFFFSVMASIIIYDIVSSPNLPMSRTMRFLEHYGILALADQTWSHMKTGFTVSSNWLKTNCPAYFASACDTIGPYLILAWESTKDFAINAEIVTRPHRALIADKTLQFFHWVYDLSPETWIWCSEKSWMAWEIIRDNSLQFSSHLWKHSLHLAEHVDHWFTENILTMT